MASLSVKTLTGLTAGLCAAGPERELQGTCLAGLRLVSQQAVSGSGGTGDPGPCLCLDYLIIMIPFL